MTRADEERFVKGAFRALIERGAATEQMLTPSTVADQDIDKFERTFDIRVPSLFRTYLKAYCYDFSVICAPVPVDGMVHCEWGSEKGLWWMELVSLPKEDPLKNLYAFMESFRSICTDSDLVNLGLDKVKNFIPIGEWDGLLCMDVSQTDVQADNPRTWQLSRFEQTAFDWEKAGYIDEGGVVTGKRTIPDFKTLLEIYFYGKYDREYERQLRECGEEMPDYSYYIQK